MTNVPLLLGGHRKLRTRHNRNATIAIKSSRKSSKYRSIIIGETPSRSKSKRTAVAPPIRRQRREQTLGTPWNLLLKQGPPIWPVFCGRKRSPVRVLTAKSLVWSTIRGDARHLTRGRPDTIHQNSRAHRIDASNCTRSGLRSSFTSSRYPTGDEEKTLRPADPGRRSSPPPDSCLPYPIFDRS